LPVSFIFTGKYPSMKYCSALFFALLFCLCAKAQVNMPADTRFRVHRLQELVRSSGNRPDIERLQQEFPLVRIEGHTYVSFLASVNASFDPSIESTYPVRIGSRAGNIISLRVRLDQLHVISSLPGLDIVQIAGKISPLLEKSVKETRADSVHRGIDLPQPFSGKDVIIGITDWGFDYTHPMFYDTNLTETRILAAWDQYKTSGPAPSGFLYGTEYNGSVDLLAAGSDTSNVYQRHYHGTHVAGIAGGSGAGTIYRGLAFEANFLFCSFLVDEAAVLDAYNWMKSKAAAEDKRLVINQSWGLHHMGTLDGTSLLSQAIDAHSGQGIVFVSSGGNNGDVNFHIRKTFAQDTICSRVTFYPYSAHPAMWGQSISAWGQTGMPFSISVAVYNNSNQLVAQTPFYATDQVSAYVDTMLVIGSDTVFYNLTADDAYPTNLRPHIRLRVKNRNTSLRICMYSAATSGTVDYWNVTELTNGVGNWGMDFTNPGLPDGIAGDRNYGISEPGCTGSVISVAAYQSPSGTSGGNLASFSSWGPRPDEIMKPDISAPGVNVGSSISSYTDGSYTTLTTVSFNSRTYPFARLSGTSMSSPTVAGIVALMLDANHWLTPSDIKDILKETAREDSKTGDIPDTGSVRWGWGKVNAYAAVKASYYFIGLPDPISSELIVYPNPAAASVNIFGLEPGELYALSIFNPDGRQVKSVSSFTNGNSVNIAELPAGMYILILQNGKQKICSKIIKS